MFNTALQIENVSKLYKLGVISTGTLSHDLNHWGHNVRELEDPYRRVVESNVPNKISESGYVWALKDVVLMCSMAKPLALLVKTGQVLVFAPEKLCRRLAFKTSK